MTTVAAAATPTSRSMRLATLWTALLAGIGASAQPVGALPRDFREPLAPRAPRGALDDAYAHPDDAAPIGLPGRVTDFTFLEAITVDSGRRVRYRFYPESETVVARVGVRDDRRHTADGPAAFRAPDGSVPVRGQYVRGRAEGTWMALRATDGGGHVPPCPGFFDAATHAGALAAARALYRELGLLDHVTVVEERYRRGQREGSARVRLLDGRELSRGRFRLGTLVQYERRPYRDSLDARLAAGRAEELPDVSPAREPDGEGGFAVVERMPAFTAPECLPAPRVADREALQVYKRCTEAAMLTHIYAGIEYPASSRARGITGRSIVGFTVERDGRIREVRTVGFTSAALDAEARRVIAEMPPWQPGLQRGLPVRVSFVLPIDFGLE